jgi:hypothetical protein
MPGALLTQQSVDEFREWLKTMPPSRFERRVTGACDASLEKPNKSPPRYTLENARRALQFLARKLSPADLAEVWRRMEPHIVRDQSPRRNGNA